MANLPRLPVLIALAALGAALTCAAAARDETTSPPAAHVIQTLRRSRVERSQPAEVFVRELQEPGLPALVPLLEILVERSIPALAEGERAQTLSVPQRELILAAIGAWPNELARDWIERRLEAQPTPGARIAALYLLSIGGTASDVEQAASLALSESESALSEDLEAAFQAAVTGVLSRDARAFGELDVSLRRARAELRIPLVFAVSATRDPRALPFFTRVLTFFPELAPAALGTVRLLGRSPRLEHERELAAEVRRYLAHERTELACAAARTLGELADPECVAALIELLESGARLREESALSALQGISGMSLPPTRAAWQGWLEREHAAWRRAERAATTLTSSRSPAQRLASLQQIAGVQLFRDDAATLILDLIQDDDEGLRAAACEALGRLRAPLAYEALLGALADESERVLSSAHDALERISGRTLPDEPQACRTALRM